jgi:hypothetical protein
LKPDSSRFKPDDSRFNPDSSRFNPDSSRFNPDSSRFNPDSSRFNPDSSRFKPDDSRFKPDSSHFKPDNSHFNPDSSRKINVGWASFFNPTPKIPHFLGFHSLPPNLHLLLILSAPLRLERETTHPIMQRQEKLRVPPRLKKIKTL